MAVTTACRALQGRWQEVRGKGSGHQVLVAARAGCTPQAHTNAWPTQGCVEYKVACTNTALHSCSQACKPAGADAIWYQPLLLQLQDAAAVALVHQPACSTAHVHCGLMLSMPGRQCMPLAQARGQDDSRQCPTHPVIAYTSLCSSSEPLSSRLIPTP
jgi:hypothetical protein